MKKYIILSLIITSCLTAACSLKEPPVLGMACRSDNDGELSYILEAGNKVFPGDGVWEDAFDYQRCPEGYSCGVDGDNKYYCYNKCEPEGIRCEGNSCMATNDAGIVIDNDNYCGARGLCNSSDTDSNNYKGVKCESPQKCIDGVCKCENDRCDCGNEICGKDNVCKNDNKRCGKDCHDCTANEQVCDAVQGICVSCEAGNEFDSEFNKCLSADARNCGGVDCTTTISHWASNGLKCVEGQCVVSECEVGYHISKNGNCEQDTDSVCGKDRIDCTVVELAHAETVGCVEGKCAATKCKNGDFMMPLVYWNNPYREEFVPDDTGTLPLSDGIIGWFRHIYQLKNGVCTEINKKTFCGNSNLDCSVDNKECVGELPALRCLNGHKVTGCEDQVEAANDDYCVLNYSCKCPAGQHPSEDQLGCDDDSITNCGGEGEAYNCNKKCQEEIEHCESVSQCDNGLCIFSCESGFSACIPKQKCLVSGASGSALQCEHSVGVIGSGDECGGGAIK